MYNLLGVLYLQLRTYMYMYISKEYKYERKSYEVVRLDGWIQISSVVLPTKFKIRYSGTRVLKKGCETELQIRWCTGSDSIGLSTIKLINILARKHKKINQLAYRKW